MPLSHPRMFAPAQNARPGAGEDHRADARVGVGSLHRVPHLGLERIAQGVEMLRVVAGDDEHAVSLLGEDVLVGHGTVSLLGLV